MFQRFLYAILIPAVLLTSLTACGVRRPQAQVQSVRLVEQTHEAARLEAVIQLENPNQVPLTLAGSRYALSVPGVASASLAEAPRRTLPARGRQRVVLPIVLRTGGENVRGARYRLRGSIAYQEPGEVRELLTESRVPLPTVGFSKSGRLE